VAAVSLRGLVTLDRLMAGSRKGAEQTAELAGHMQRLADLGATMERAARQYLVLDDASLRERYDAAARELAEDLAALAASPMPKAEFAAWRSQLDGITALLDGPRTTALAREQALALAFRELDGMRNRLDEQLQHATDARSRALLDELDAGRARLAQQVIGAMLLSVLLALGFGVWLARPLARLEEAMVALGDNRLQTPIDIRGPADVRRLSRRLDWLRQRLTEIDADKSRFLRHVSHELKTPLAALREGVSLLEDGVTGELSEAQREVARILRQNTAVVQRQIEDLLDFNAAAFEARRLVRRKTELAALTDRVVTGQQLQWQARQLKVQCEGGPLWAEVDADKLATALANLLSNAIRFSPVGGRIALSLSFHPPLARIDVSDQGPGIAPEDRVRVFEPFYRGTHQPEGALRGSGIGLSIVHEVVAAHAATITLVPAESGAHFRIELPHATLA
jgi:two-component system sensor histidine kinase GlrK